jgi:hypothetical protein
MFSIFATYGFRSVTFGFWTTGSPVFWGEGNVPKAWSGLYKLDADIRHSQLVASTRINHPTRELFLRLRVSQLQYVVYLHSLAQEY